MTTVHERPPPLRPPSYARLRLNLGLYWHFDEELCLQLLSSARLWTYHSGQTILPPDSEPSLVGSIVSGIARMAVHDRQGKVQLAGFLVRSDIFGHSFARLGSFSLEAATETLVCQFDLQGFNALVLRHPALREQLIEQTLAELEGTREWLSLLGTRNAMERLASFLLVLLHYQSAARLAQGLAADQKISVPISRTDLANFLSMTPETISRCLHQLVDRHALRLLTPRLFQIIDEEKLLRASNWCEIPESMSVARMCRAFSASGAPVASPPGRAAGASSS